MKEQFIPYQEALELKELGFNQPCFGFYNEICEDNDKAGCSGKFTNMCGWTIGRENTDDLSSRDFIVIAPLYQQAFDWFRKEHNALAIIFNDDGDVEFGNICFNYEIRFITITFKEKQKSSVVGNYRYNTYEEARLACLQELIKIVKK